MSKPPSRAEKLKTEYSRAASVGLWWQKKKTQLFTKVWRQSEFWKKYKSMVARVQFL